jgi:acyl-CoA synthetase (AMP-forming)/AMP-acid ligase II
MRASCSPTRRQPTWSARERRRHCARRARRLHRGARFRRLARAGRREARPVDVQPSWAFNIIYSSGTTGEPKGIVQGHGMRWAHVQRGAKYEYSPDTVTLLSTPLYSNTTLVVFFPTIAFGGCVVLMPKFDARRLPQLAQERRVTHTMLVPVQYQRLMAHPALRRARPLFVPVQVQHQRALQRRAQGRRAQALARRADRVLRHDRRRRHLHPRGAPAPDQAAHRGPARPKAATSG